MSEKILNGYWLSEWMAERRFTNPLLAERLGVTVPTIWRWRQQSEQLKESTLLALYAIDIAELDRIERSSKDLKAITNGG